MMRTTYSKEVRRTNYAEGRCDSNAGVAAQYGFGKGTPALARRGRRWGVPVAGTTLPSSSRRQTDRPRVFALTLPIPF